MPIPLPHSATLLPPQPPAPEELEQWQWAQARRLLEESRTAREALVAQAELSVQRDWIELRGLLGARPELRAPTLAFARQRALE